MSDAFEIYESPYSYDEWDWERYKAPGVRVTLVVPSGKTTRARVRDQRGAWPRVALIQSPDERGHGCEIRLARATRQRLLRQPRRVLRQHRGRVAPVIGSPFVVLWMRHLRINRSPAGRNVRNRC